MVIEPYLSLNITLIIDEQLKTDILPELPMVSPLSHRDFANLHIESRSVVSLI